MNKYRVVLTNSPNEDIEAEECYVRDGALVFTGWTKGINSHEETLRVIAPGKWIDVRKLDSPAHYL